MLVVGIEVERFEVWSVDESWTSIKVNGRAMERAVGGAVLITLAVVQVKDGKQTDRSFLGARHRG